MKPEPTVSSRCCRSTAEITTAVQEAQKGTIMRLDLSCKAWLAGWPESQGLSDVTLQDQLLNKSLAPGPHTV